MTAMVEIHIPLRTSNPTRGGQGRHWAITAGKRKRERLKAWAYLRPHKAPSLPCVVTLVRMSPVTMDSDGLRPALKSVRDETAIWLGLPLNKRGHAEDNDPRVHWAYQQGHALKGADRHAVIVIVESVPQTIVDAKNGAEKYRLDPPRVP